MNSDKKDLVVIGGGISGLGFAHLARRKGFRPLVLEATDRLGGCLHSHSFSVPQGEFWAELGAHTCYNSYGNLLAILEDLEQLQKLQSKEKLPFRMLTEGGLRSIPSQLSFLELLGSLPNLLRLKKEQLDVAGYYGGIIGRRNFQRVLGPALDAVICQPAAEFPADALFRKKPRRKEIARSFTGSSGVQAFSDAIGAQEGIEVRTGTPVCTLTRSGEGFVVQLAGGSELQARRVALAVGPDLAAELLQAQFPRLAELLQPIEIAEIESRSVLVAAQALELDPLAGIIAAQDDFYSVVARDPVPDPKYRGFTFHFRPGRLSNEQKRERICSVLGLTPEKIIAETDRRNRLPALRLGHKERIQAIDRVLAAMPLAITGNWFLGVSIEDCLTRSASECERLFGSGAKTE
jgi:protoporphyrinogen oxidase